MKSYLKPNSKVFYNKFLNKSILFKYNLKYKVMIRRISYILRNKKFFGIKRFFFGVLISLVLFFRKGFSVYNVFFFRRLFIRYFLVNRHKVSLKKNFSSKLFRLLKKISLKNVISKQLVFLLSKNVYFLCLNKHKLLFIKQRINFMYFWTDCFFSQVGLFTLGFLKGFSYRFLAYVKCNYSLLSNFFFDYANSILSDSRSFLSLNPVILNNIIAF